MAYKPPKEIAETAAHSGIKKANMSVSTMLVLGFLAGAFIAIGFLLDIRTTGNLPKAWGSFGAFLGGAVFPVGLMLVIIAGGELLTGNMMAVPIAVLSRRATGIQLVRNWFWITIGNFIGSIFVAYFFGHVVGLTEAGPFLAKTVSIAQGKLHDNFIQAFFSGIGCNWLVALAVWMAYGAEDVGGKILGIWFPIMAFVAIGFQHIVANMFVIPAAIFAGKATWIDYLANFVPVYLGNAVGGAIFVGAVYWYSYLRDVSETKVDNH
ncbi:formate/nitrite transporter family protein [Aneurinibacillus sp. Ricciae_BoGa-3]|uniref:formate/nitrite transporter family protein n=1 Tax=Aneurinibacillus sp. Ricciae_BoGa-3 TaxID=3022697 RepID=UPI0023418631|nr:formate/nitrite transporter family protein [Aneurinibacillus sp. Ricciae_BoGa-3]WCK56601.1 formate/nitrite transporter family protein [Aneurinibacillus sp. Ricciae_BoGa-3]